MTEGEQLANAAAADVGATQLRLHGPLALLEQPHERPHEQPMALAKPSMLVVMQMEHELELSCAALHVAVATSIQLLLLLLLLLLARHHAALLVEQPLEHQTVLVELATLVVKQVDEVELGHAALVADKERAAANAVAASHAAWHLQFQLHLQLQ